MHHRIQIFLVTLLLLAAGCTRTIDPNFRAPPVLEDPLPIAVGVYYGQAIRNHRLTNQPPTEIDFTVRTGQAHVSMFDNLFSEIFESAVPVDSKYQAKSGKAELDAIIEPEIDLFSYAFVDDGSMDMKVPVKARYLITLYSTTGDTLHVWTVSSEGMAQGISYLTLDDSIEIAMRGAAAQFVVAVYGDADLLRCLSAYSTAVTAEKRLEPCFQEP